MRIPCPVYRAEWVIILINQSELALLDFVYYSHSDHFWERIYFRDNLQKKCHFATSKGLILRISLPIAARYLRPRGKNTPTRLFLTFSGESSKDDRLGLYKLWFFVFWKSKTAKASSLPICDYVITMTHWWWVIMIKIVIAYSVFANITPHDRTYECLSAVNDSSLWLMMTSSLPVMP